MITTYATIWKVCGSRDPLRRTVVLSTSGLQEEGERGVTTIIIIIITRPKPAYGRQGLVGSWGQDTDEVSTFLVFLTSHFAPAALSSDLTNLGPLMTMKIHLETFKNHGNQPKTMKNHETTLKNHETTLKNHGNQPKTVKNLETALENYGNKPKTMKKT